MREISLKEVNGHASLESCWVVLYGKVYDVTSFLSQHPGGSAAILRLAGQDATDEYDPIHPPGVLDEHLSASCLGTLYTDFSSVGTNGTKEKTHVAKNDDDSALTQLLNLHEIEVLAKRKLSHKAWAYYVSASDDNVTKIWNNTIYQSILLRPRVFVDGTECDLSTTLLGFDLGLPIYASPAAMARLAHPSGEAGIAAACGAYGALQIISHNASMTPADIVREAKPGQVFGWQLYCLKDVQQSEQTIARINKINEIKFIVLTLDAPFPGKREVEIRSKMDWNRTNNADSAPQVWGTDASLTWEKTLLWLRKHTKLPIVLKGIQTYEDAILAAKYAPEIRGIILSNHGGRALDTASTAMHTLMEINRNCSELFQKLDVMVDGGIKRGTDVVKALALGAKAVGIGRAPLWGLAVGGQKGVERTLEILADETKTAMRLLGVSHVHQLSRQHINTRLLEAQTYGQGITSRL